MVPGWTEARVRERDKVEGRGGSQEEGGEREMVDIGGGSVEGQHSVEIWLISTSPGTVVVSHSLRILKEPSAGAPEWPGPLSL